jgi:hypothetical protein
MDRKEASTEYQGQIKISLCRCRKEEDGSFQSSGTWLNSLRHQSEADALREADDFRMAGFAVIVAPMYNHNNKHSYHEWRSFDGGDFVYTPFNDPS